MSSGFFCTTEWGKMCKHKHALKRKMIRDEQKRRSSPDPKADPDPTLAVLWETKSSFHFSHGPATPDTNTGQSNAEKTIRGHQGSMGTEHKSSNGWCLKTFLRV